MLLAHLHVNTHMNTEFQRVSAALLGYVSTNSHRDDRE